MWYIVKVAITAWRKSNTNIVLDRRYNLTCGIPLPAAAPPIKTAPAARPERSSCALFCFKPMSK